MQIRKLNVTKSIVLAFGGIICASALWAGEAWATKLLTTNNPTAMAFADGNPHIILTKTINLKKKGPVMIMYTAECRALASDTSSAVSISIVVDGKVIQPTGINLAFCTSTGATTGAWISAATQVRKILDAGSRTIQIIGQLQGFNSGETWRIDDQSLNIIVQRN